MKKIFKRYIEESKGLSAIELGISTLIVLLCICFFIDLTTNIYKFNALSSTATYVTRIVEAQGGIAPTSPSGYKSEFVSTADIYKDVKKIMNNAGVKDSEFDVKVNGISLTNPNAKSLKYYGETISVSVEINYSWGLVKNFIGLNNNYTKSTTRYAKSTLINRNNSNTSGEFGSE